MQIIQITKGDKRHHHNNHVTVLKALSSKPYIRSISLIALDYMQRRCIFAKEYREANERTSKQTSGKLTPDATCCCTKRFREGAVACIVERLPINPVAGFDFRYGTRLWRFVTRPSTLETVYLSGSHDHLNSGAVSFFIEFVWDVKGTTEHHMLPGSDHRQDSPWTAMADACVSLHFLAYPWFRNKNKSKKTSKWPLYSSLHIPTTDTVKQSLLLDQLD